MGKKPLHTTTTITVVGSTGSVLPIRRPARIPEYGGEWIMAGVLTKLNEKEKKRKQNGMGVVLKYNEIER